MYMYRMDKEMISKNKGKNMITVAREAGICFIFKTTFILIEVILGIFPYHLPSFLC